MTSSTAERFSGRTAADVMLSTPKTLPSNVTVEVARLQLDRGSVQILLLVDGPLFVGAITRIPPDAAPEESALQYATAMPETISPNEPATVAFARAGANADRRIVVVDDQGRLAGLLCLNQSRTQFCGGNTV